MNTVDAAPPPRAGRTMTLGLQRRLLVLLLIPLVVLALVSAWIDYRSADTAALQQDAQLLRMVPMLADSIVVPDRPGASPVVLLAPPVEEFLKDRSGHAAFSVSALGGGVLFGEEWLEATIPETRDPEFHTREQDGTTYRIVAQRVDTSAGEFVMQLADGSDPRQQWRRSVLLRVFFPNLVLLLLTGLAMHYAVHSALRPLIALKEAVERRSPRDLSPIAENASPDEVRPLVQSLNRLFGMVNAQSESQRRFVADAAHQLRTPLAGLQALVEAWAQAAERQAAVPPHMPPNSGSNPVPAQYPPTSGAIVLEAEELVRLRDATRRTSQLAHQLLALSRADAHTMHGQVPAPVELRSLCGEMLEVHFDAASAKGIDLGLEGKPVTVLGHEWLLRELLGNLVDNAVRYTQPGGTVTIRCGPGPAGVAGPTALLEVEDNGPGIARSERSRVVERFYRVPGTEGEGSGLGLAIAEEIAHLHRSRLELRPGDFGRGLRIAVLFQAHAPQRDSGPVGLLARI